MTEWRAGTLFWLVVATAIVGGFLFGVTPGPDVTERGGGPILDLRFADSGRDLIGYLTALRSGGRNLYTVLLLGDIAWAILNATTLAGLIAVGFWRAKAPLSWLRFVAYGYLAADVTEDMAIIAGLAFFPDPPQLIIDHLGHVTVAKFGLLAAAVALAVVAVVSWGVMKALGSARRPVRR